MPNIRRNATETRAPNGEKSHAPQHWQNLHTRVKSGCPRNNATSSSAAHRIHRKSARSSSKHIALYSGASVVPANHNIGGERIYVQCEHHMRIWCAALYMHVPSRGERMIPLGAVYLCTLYTYTCKYSMYIWKHTNTWFERISSKENPLTFEWPKGRDPI